MAHETGRGRGLWATPEEDLAQRLLDNLFFRQARFPAVATTNDWYLALAYTVRDLLLARWGETAATYFTEGSRTVCYLSAEYLLGPHLGNALLNLGQEEEVREAAAIAGLDLDELLAQEEEPGLGNGGLGRLAACYLDSLATLEIPTIGYGIRYEYGIFDQEIRDGWQVEVTDKWLRLGNPWEIARPEIACPVGFGGRTEPWVDEEGRYRVRWIPARTVRGVAYDTPILGYRVNTANLLRLWSAQAVESFDFAAFNVGDYYGAVEEKLVSENLTKILYPNDELLEGKRLRLEQQYFFVACALADMIRIHRQRDDDILHFADKYAVQLNDTHPSVAVPELMRLLVDEHLVPWDAAWELTTRTFAYTNHTLLPEALERWSVPLFGEVLPRHLEIVREIDRRFLDEVRVRAPGDADLPRRVSIVADTEPPSIRMAHLATVGSHTINGVAELHTRLLTESVLADFARLWPDRFTNVTNGVTPRRFLALVNPGLAELVTETIGEGWLTDLERLEELEAFRADAGFRDRFAAVKRENKVRLAVRAAERAGVEMDPDALLDVLVKRIHEYKRQHLCALAVVARYLRLKDDPTLDLPPRTVLFAGKAAPGYALAKLVIRLVNGIAEVVNDDPATRDRLRVVFMPDFNVTNAQPIYPAADLSEQISTAGYEASGTGNMKLGLNGAVTIGTLDGANVEIREAVGAEHFFLFGLDAAGVQERRTMGYAPAAVVGADPELRRVLEVVGSGLFSRGDRELFKPLLDRLLDHDHYLALADFRSYLEAQDEADRAYADRERWLDLSIANTSRLGRFSSDRSIREYCERIWRVEPVPVEVSER